MKRLFVLSTLAASLSVPAQALARDAVKPDAPEGRQAAGNGQATGKQQMPEDSSAERRYTAEGVVSALDADQVTLDTDEGPLDFNLDDSVRIYREGKRVPRNAIQSGDRARATYLESQDGNLDDEVLVRLDLLPGNAGDGE
jgi:hypothetical protein